MRTLERYLAKKKEIKREKKAVAVAKEVESKNIADPLEQNKSAALKCLFGMVRQTK